MLKLIANVSLRFFSETFSKRTIQKEFQNAKKQDIFKKAALYGENYYPDCKTTRGSNPKAEIQQVQK